jgi:hypothetical protein
MFKKIALAAALAATASFATWDYFPVKEAGHGQAQISEKVKMQGKSSKDIVELGVRYSIIQNFEAGLKVPVTVLSYYDGKNDERNGLGNLELMLRYQFMPIMNAFLDVGFPTCSKDICGNDDPFGFHFGVQYSQNFGLVNFGSELGLKLETAGDDKTTPPWDLNIGLEADFAVSQMFTPYVGADIDILIGKYTFDGDNYGKSHTGDLGIAPFLGLNIAINPMFYVDLSAKFGIGDDYYGDKTPIWLTGKFGINF